MNLRSLLRPWCLVFGHVEHSKAKIDAGVDSVYWYYQLQCPRCLCEISACGDKSDTNLHIAIRSNWVDDEYSASAEPFWRR